MEINFYNKVQYSKSVDKEGKVREKNQIVIGRMSGLFLCCIAAMNCQSEESGAHNV